MREEGAGGIWGGGGALEKKWLERGGAAEKKWRKGGGGEEKID